jgi:hypothetical protein
MIPQRIAMPAFPSNFVLAATLLLTGAAAFALRLLWPVGVQTFGLQLGYFASYIVLFVAGCCGASGHWLNAVPANQRRLWLILSCVAVPVLPVADALASRIAVLQGNVTGGWNAPAAVYAFWEPLVAWGFILGLLHTFTRRFSRLGPRWTALVRRAYTIFIIHPPVLVAIALAWREVSAPHLVKFAITGTATCVVCFWIAGQLLRVPVIRRVV